MRDLTFESGFVVDFIGLSFYQLLGQNNLLGNYMKRRSFKQDKIARVYDSEILPLWTQKFGRLLLRAVRVPSKAMVLNVACKTGYPALELLQKMDPESRIIAIESSGPLLDIARSKAGDLSGRRVFFRTEHISEKLSFADDVYDVTFTNLGLDEFDISPEEVVKDFARVTQPGGQVLFTLPLRGSWDEFFDIYREVLIKQDRNDLIEKIEEYMESFPEPETAAGWMKKAGLRDVKVESEKFSLLFKSAREFFFAPIIEYGPLKTWKSLVGKGQQMQDIFWYIKEAIDAYFSSTAFSVSVIAGCIHGLKPTEEQLLNGDMGLEEEQHIDEDEDPTHSIDLGATLGEFAEEEGLKTLDGWEPHKAEGAEPLGDEGDFSGAFDEDDAEVLDPEDLQEISPEPEEEDTEIESAITDPHQKPSIRRDPSGSFGGEAAVATVDEKPLPKNDSFERQMVEPGDLGGIGDLGEEEEDDPFQLSPHAEDRRPSLEELEAAFDEVDGAYDKKKSKVDPFADIRPHTAELDESDLEELEDLEALEEHHEYNEADEGEGNLSEPIEPTSGVDLGVDDEDLPTMENYRRKPGKPASSAPKSSENADEAAEKRIEELISSGGLIDDDGADEEDIDQDDIPTKGPHPGPFNKK